MAFGRDSVTLPFTYEDGGHQVEISHKTAQKVRLLIVILNMQVNQKVQNSEMNLRTIFCVISVICPMFVL